MSEVDEKPWQDEDWLRTKCIDEGLSSGDIAREHDITPRGVRYWMEKFDIPRRPMARIELTPKKMRKLYWDEQLSERDIAKKIDCTHQAVDKFLRRNGIERRGQSSSTSLGKGGDGSGVNYLIDSRGHMCWKVNEGGSNKRMSVHRLLAIAEHGIDAVKDRHVHHVNHCSWDNRVENLEVLDGSEHLSYHAHIREGGHDPPWEEVDDYAGFTKENKKVKAIE